MLRLLQISDLHFGPPFVPEVGDAVKRLHDFDFPMTHEAMSTLTRAVPTDDSQTWDELGIEPRPVEETLRDTLAWMVQHGHIKRERA